jgi:hypothetical protein
MQPIDDQEPARTVVASHGSYRSAQQDADRLVVHGFPPERISVRVRGLRLARPRPGARVYLRSAVRWALLVGAVGALLGLWVGGVLLSLPAGVALAVAAGSTAVSVAAALAAGIGVQALLARVRCDTGVDILQADRFDVAVDRRFAETARRLLFTGQAAGRDGFDRDDPGNRRI